MVGVEGDLLEEAPVASLPVAVELTIQATSTLPDALVRTESAIGVVAEQLGGCIAGTIRGATELWTLVYLPTDQHASRFAEIPLPSGASISVAPTIDPEWTLFEQARPVDMEVQSMLDFRVMSQLHASGDRGGVRRIDHVIVDLSADDVQSFIAAVSSVLGPVESEHDAGANSWTISHDADPAEITADSWTIRQIAERHRAEYDGWGCPMVDGHEAMGAKRRWWQRR